MKTDPASQDITDFLALAEQSSTRALRIVKLEEELKAAREVLQNIADEEDECDEWEGASKFRIVRKLAENYLTGVKA